VRIVFTEHALRRMEERGVTREDVYEVLGEPDELLLDTETGRLVAVKYGAGLCVVADITEDVAKVVTVLINSNLERLVERRKRKGRWAPWLRRQD